MDKSLGKNTFLEIHFWGVAILANISATADPQVAPLGGHQYGLPLWAASMGCLDIAPLSTFSLVFHTKVTWD